MGLALNRDKIEVCLLEKSLVQNLFNEYDFCDTPVELREFLISLGVIMDQNLKNNFQLNAVCSSSYF